MEGKGIEDAGTAEFGIAEIGKTSSATIKFELKAYLQVEQRRFANLSKVDIRGIPVREFNHSTTPRQGQSQVPICAYPHVGTANACPLTSKRRVQFLRACLLTSDIDPLKSRVK